MKRQQWIIDYEFRSDFSICQCNLTSHTVIMIRNAKRRGHLRSCIGCRYSNDRYQRLVYRKCSSRWLSSAFFLQSQTDSFRHPNWTATPHTDYSIYLILTRQFKSFSYLEIRNMWLNVFEDCYQSTPKCLLNELNVASSAQRASRAKH